LPLKILHKKVYTTLRSSDTRKLEEKNRKLKEMTLSQSLTITRLKKEMNWDEDRGGS